MKPDLWKPPVPTIKAGEQIDINFEGAEREAICTKYQVPNTPDLEKDPNTGQWYYRGQTVQDYYLYMNSVYGGDNDNTSMFNPKSKN